MMQELWHRKAASKQNKRQGWGDLLRLRKKALPLMSCWTLG